MTILLDIDGVLVTTHAWRKVETMPDGFMKFDEEAANNLAALLKETNASIVLTTTHRISRNEEKWTALFKDRGFVFNSLTKVNGSTKIEQLTERYKEVKEWVETAGKNENYVVIDDDTSLYALPESIKSRWVVTKPLVGFDKVAYQKALDILMGRGL